MNIGDFNIEQLSEGFFELFEDGTFQKMDPIRLTNVPEDPNLGRYSSALGIDPLLISRGDEHIIVDPGLGWGLDHRSRYNNTSNVVTNLAIFDLTPDDITHVIFTHLHYDHAAGATYVSDDFTTQATFPNATYYLHQDEWEYALQCTQQPSGPVGADYRLDEFYKLIAEKRVHLIEDDEFTVTEGITVVKTGGHTPGHMIVSVEHRGDKGYFTGDLIPTEYHLNHYPMKRVDTDPVQAKKVKTLLLRKACSEQAVLLFFHSLYRKAGLLSLDKKKKYILQDIEQDLR